MDDPRGRRGFALALPRRDARSDRVLVRGEALDGAPDRAQHPPPSDSGPAPIRPGPQLRRRRRVLAAHHRPRARHPRLRRDRSELTPGRRARCSAVLDALAAEGPSDEELEHELDDHRASHADAGGAGSHLDYLAAQYLFGDASPETVSFLAEQEQLTAAEVAAAIASARGSMIAIVPETVESLPGLDDYPVNSPGTIDSGRRFRTPGLRLRRSESDPELVVGTDGVMMTYGRSRDHRAVRSLHGRNPVPGRVAHADHRRRLLRAGRAVGLEGRKAPWSRSTLRSPPTAWSRWSPARRGGLVGRRRRGDAQAAVDRLRGARGASRPPRAGRSRSCR